RLSGYASVFWIEGDLGTEYQIQDDVRERIMPGAFDRALAEQDDVRCLVNHDESHILGRTSAKPPTLTLSVDKRGLKYEVSLPNTQTGRDIAESIRRGDIRESSFQFVPSVVSWTEEGDTLIREIREVRLYDVSPVTFPAYTGTDVYARHVVDAD